MVSTEFILYMAGLLTALTVIWKSAVKVKKTLTPVVQLPTRVTALEVTHSEIQNSLSGINASLEEIKNEVKTNGSGMSLKKALHAEKEARWMEYEISNKAVWETGHLTNGELGCVRATEALVRLVGSSPLGAGWLAALDPGDRDRISKSWQTSIDLGSPYDEIQRFIHKDGKGKKIKTVYVRSFFKPTFNEIGEFIGGLGQFFEISKEEYEDYESRRSD